MARRESIYIPQIGSFTIWFEVLAGLFFDPAFFETSAKKDRRRRSSQITPINIKNRTKNEYMGFAYIGTLFDGRFKLIDSLFQFGFLREIGIRP
jgi:hypothetical protein